MSKLDLENTFLGTADMHTIESIEVEHRRVAGAPSVVIRCECDGVFDLHEFSDHVATVAWKAISMPDDAKEQPCGCWSDGEGFALCSWHEERFRSMVDPAREYGDAQRRRAEAAEARLA